MDFEFKLPDIGEGVVEGEIVRWLIKEGDRVDEDQPVAEVMTDKATVELPSPVEGTILKCIGAEGDMIDVGATLVVIAVEGNQHPALTSEPSDTAEKAEPVVAGIKSKPERRKGIRATPAIRNLARSKGIDLTLVQGSGTGGRILSEDLEQFLANSQSASKEVSGQPGVAEEVIESIPYRGLRRKIGGRLTVSKRNAVHYTFVDEADVTQLVKLRTELQDRAPHLTFLPFFMKAIVAGLKRFPLLNAVLDEASEVIQLKRFYNLGIATATSEGLVVPVIRGVDRKSLFELAEEVERIVNLTRSGRVKVEDLQGGTFTITSLGPRGGLVATPVINYPEVAILGIHKIQQRPVVRNGRVVVRDMVNLSISLDHRVVDGVVAADFMLHVIRLLANPALLFLEED